MSVEKAEARELAGRRDVSALVNDGLRLRLQQARVSRLLDEMDDEFGPLPDGAQAAVARRWDA